MTSEQAMLRETARAVVESKVLTHMADAERDEQFPPQVVAPLREAGLLGGTIPVEWGGAGLDHVSHALVVEEVSSRWQVLGSLVAMASGPVGRGLLTHGTDAQRERWLRPLAEGTALAGYALTEPDSGSDASAMRTRAERTDAGYVLTGAKTWIDWANDGDFFLTFARTEPGSVGAKGISAFIVPHDAPGLTTTIMRGKLGMRALSVGELVMDECEVAAENLVGEPGRGFAVAMSALEEARLMVAARISGGIAGVLRAVAAYIEERELFGRKLGDFQMTQAKVADMVVALECARTLTFRAAMLKDRGLPASRAVLTAKLFAQEAYMDVSRDAVQLFGAYGMSEEYEVNRHFRDAKVSEVTGGTSEILRILLSEQVRGRSRR
nr:acyl-CoA dehydrogenase family protein [Euzebya pacifica]